VLLLMLIPQPPTVVVHRERERCARWQTKPLAMPQEPMQSPMQDPLQSRQRPARVVQEPAALPTAHPWATAQAQR
jgi:hypothetical protein